MVHQCKSKALETTVGRNTHARNTANTKEKQDANKSSHQLPLSNSIASDNPSTSIQRFQDILSYCTRNYLPDLPLGNEEQLNSSYNSMLSHPPLGVCISAAGGSSSVSLTLALHQNNAIGLSEPFSMNATQRFGLRVESSEGFDMGSFEAQNRHFGRDVIVKI